MANETITAILDNQTLYMNLTKLFNDVGLTKFSIFKNVYIQSLVIFLVLMIVVNIIVYVIKKYIQFLTRKTKTNIDDLLIEKTQQPITIVLYISALKLAIIPLIVPPVFARILDSIIVILFTVIAVRVIDVLLDSWGKAIAKKTKSKVDDELITLAHKASKVVLVLIGLMFILSVWGIEIGPLLASLGIAGIAIAFALQSALGNIIGGISLIIDKTIKVGDKIVLESGEMGTVHDIGLRSTRIMNFDGEMLSVPNGMLSNMKIVNWGDPAPPARFTVNFGVTYGTDVEKVQRIAMKSIKKVKMVAKDPEPVVYFGEMGDFSLNFMARCWVEDFNDRYAAKQEVTRNIYNDFNKAGLNFAFPTQSLYVEKFKMEQPKKKK